MTILGGTGSDSLDTFAGTVGRNLSVNLGNALTDPLKTNTFAFTGTVLGSRLTYIGGTGFDDVRLGDPILGGTLQGVYVSVMLGAGDDSLSIAATGLRYLYADFGAGADSFTTTAPMNY